MKKVWSHILIVSVAILILSACGNEPMPEQDKSSPVRVKTARVTLQPMGERAVYSGTVIPIDEARISTKVMGTIEAIPFDEGERVEQGQLVVKLRSKEIEAKRAQAEAAITEAEAHFKNAQTNLKRIESLFEKKAATQKELDDMRTAFESVKARLQTAREMKKEVEELLQYAEIQAPFTGVITAKMMKVGNLATPGQPILKLENLDNLRVVAKVPESDVQELQEGQLVQVEITASGAGTNGQTVANAIRQIVPSADRMSRQFEVHVPIQNPENRIKPGMYARVMMEQSGSATLLVPKNAVFRRGQLEGVYVVDPESRAQLRWVRTGQLFEDQIEILSGVNADERVVTDGHQQLVDGQPVEVVE